jgi:cAMP-dependent protein kinase regulator
VTDKKLRELEKQLKKEPANLPLRLQLAALYHEVGRTGDAVEQYRAVALQYRDEGRIQQAIAVARSALAVAPNDAELRRLVDNAVAKAAASGPTSGPAPAPSTPAGASSRVATPVAGHALPRPSGARVLDATVSVRELEPMRAPARPPGALGRSPIDSTPSQRTPSGLFTPTPLPVPMPYHEADPSKVHSMRSLGSDEESTDTHGEPTDPVAESGLSKAARRISERLIALSPGVPLPLEGEDLSTELETRKRPKVDAAMLDQLGVPPTGRVPALEPNEPEDEPTKPPPVSEPSFEPARVMRAVGRLDDDAWIEEPTDPRDADRPPSGVFDRPLGATVDALAPDGLPLAAPGGLAALPEAMRARLLAAGTVKSIAPGAAIVREGDAGESVFVLEAGEVRVCKKRPRGTPLEVARLGAGAMFGEIAVMTDRRRHATVEAIGPARVVEIPRAAIGAAADANPVLAELLDGLVRERLLSNLMAVAPFFAPIATDRRAEVLARFRPRKVAADTEVIEQGRVRQGLVLVVLGTLELSVRRPDGKIVTIASIGEGAHAGELALMADGPEPATATAVGPCELVVLPAREFYAVVADEPSVWQALRADADRRNADIAAALR